LTEVSITPQVKIIWITGIDILMPCVPVNFWSRVVVKKGMVAWKDEKTVMWIRENEYEAFRRSLHRYFDGP
jgi:hypothetical protein